MGVSTGGREGEGKGNRIFLNRLGSDVQHISLLKPLPIKLFRPNRNCCEKFTIQFQTQC